MDVNLISAMLQLGGKKSGGLNLKRAEKLMKTIQRISQTGINQIGMLEIVSELNPDMRPLLTIFSKLNSGQQEVKCTSCDDVQYINFR